MYLDVVELHKFYTQTRLGFLVRRALRDNLLALWGDCKTQTVAGFGFAPPVLSPFLQTARRVVCLMPDQQGVIAWPRKGSNSTVLCSEINWPIATGQLDRLVLLHGLETCEKPDALLSEIWRVLGPGGRVVITVPNRSGLWARRDTTPFGLGRPYSQRQLENLLGNHRFTIERIRPVLYFPPARSDFWQRSAPLWDGMAKVPFLSITAGAFMLEASKQIYALPPRGLRAAVRHPLEVLEGITTPPKPASRANLR